MRVVEVVRGLGLGGIEVSLVRRLRIRPPDAWTAVISTQPRLNTLTYDVKSTTDTLIDLDIKRWESAALLGQIRQLQPDIVVSHIPSESVKLLASDLSKEVPIVVVAHHTKSSERPWAEGLLSASLGRVNHKAALHIAVSTAAAEGSQCRGAQRVMVGPLGASLSGLDPDSSLWPSDCSVRLLSLGRLRAFKNLDGLLEGVSLVASTMRSQGAFLVIVGDGSERDRLEGLIRRHSLSDIVSLHQAISDPSGILCAADIFITVSNGEGGPVTAMEALLAGSRLASTRTGLYFDFVKHHPQVIPIESTHPKMIATALEEALLQGHVSPDERARNSDSAQLWTLENSVGRYYSALRSIVKEHSP